MASYGSIGNTTPPGGGSGDSEEERDSIRTPLVLPKGRRGMRRQPASQRSLDDYMSGYDTTSDVESGVVVRRGMSRQGASQRSLEEYMSGYDTQSDAEFFGDARPITSNLPNAAPAPFVYLGFCCAVLAGLCFTSSNVMVKYVPEVSSWQLLFVRCSMQLVTMLPLMFLSGQNIMGTPDLATRWRVVAQGILGGFLLLSIFEAVSRMPLGDCTAIFFSSPAFTMVLSFIILKDHCGFLRVLIAAILLTGVLILSRPPALFPSPQLPFHNVSLNYLKWNSTQPWTDSDHLELEELGSYNLAGILCSMAVPLLSAWIVIITRQAKHVHYSILVFWFAIGGQVVAIIGVFALDSKPLFHGWGSREWVISFMVALVGIMGSILMTKAVCWVTPSKVMVVRSFEVVAAYVLQVTVFDVPSHWTDILGTGAIIAAVLGMGLEDYVMDRLGWRFL